MSKTKKTDRHLTKEEIEKDELYGSVGLIFGMACAPESWNRAKVEDEINKKVGDPGTSLGRWSISDDSRDMDEWPTNPMPCPDSKKRKHWLFNC